MSNEIEIFRPEQVEPGSVGDFIARSAQAMMVIAEVGERRGGEGVAWSAAVTAFLHILARTHTLPEARAKFAEIAETLEDIYYPCRGEKPPRPTTHEEK